MQYGGSQETGRLRLSPYKACEVRDFRIVSDLHEVGSLPDPLEDYDTPVPNNAARDEELVIRSAEFHSPNLFQPCKELVDDFEVSFRV